MTSPEVRAVEERYSRGTLWAGIVVMFSWHLVVLATTVLGSLSSGAAGTVSAAVWIGYAAIGIVSAVIVLRGGGRGRALPLAVSPVLLLGVAAVAVTTPGDSVLSWAFSAAGWFALIALWRRPLVELAVFFAANAAIGLAVLMVVGEPDRINLTRLAMTSYGITVLPFTIFVGGRVVTSLARDIAQAHHAQALVATKQVATQAVHQARRVRQQTVQQAAASLLTGLAHNRLDLEDPITQQELRVAVTRLRRLVVETDDVPDPLLHELRACADTAERNGIAVDLQPPIGAMPALPRHARQLVADPVIQALAAARSHARITVIAAEGQVDVAIVADAPRNAMRIDHTDVHYDVGEGLLWVQATWSDQSRSLS